MGKLTKAKHSPESQISRILRLLKTQGKATNVELNRIAFRYSDRLHVLRNEGHNIVTNRIEGGLFEYIYKGEEQDN